MPEARRVVVEERAAIDDAPRPPDESPAAETIHGVVRDRHLGLPLEGVSIMEELPDEDGARVVFRRAASTRADGRFVIVPVVTPTVLLFRKQGYVDVRHEVAEHTSRRSLDVFLRTDDDAVIVVTYGDGAPLAEVSLRAAPHGGTPPLPPGVSSSEVVAEPVAETWATTDDAGRARLHDLSFALEYDLWANLARRGDVRGDRTSKIRFASGVRFVENGGERRFALPPLGEVRGRLSVNGAGVAATLFWEGEEGRGNARADEHGRFVLALVPGGTVSIRVLFSNPRVERSRQLVVAAGGVTRMDLDLSLDRTRIRGRLLVADGVGVSACDVLAIAADGARVSGVVGVDGTFVIENLAPDGEYAVEVSDGRRVKTKFSIAAGADDVEFDFR